jgi:site-specific DNA-methyltransferase (adenine-specific)
MNDTAAQWESPDDLPHRMGRDGRVSDGDDRGGEPVNFQSDNAARLEQVQIGDATLYLGNCRSVLPEIPHDAVVVTDPPYGTGGWRREAAGGGSNPKASLIREEWDSGDTDWLMLGTWPVVSFWPAARMPQFMNAIGAMRPKVRMLYMRKLDPKPQVQGRTGWSVEPIVVAGAEGFQLYGGTDWTEASTPRVGRDGDALGHPYQKPLSVMDWLIAKTRCEVICDPFMGSGTTGVAALRAGRKFIGVEREPAYFEIACKRIEAAYAQGRLFDEKQKPQEQTGFDLEDAA